MSIASQYITGRKVIIREHPILYKDANIFSTYNLCASVPFTELVASPTSVATLSILAKELVVLLGDPAYSLCTVTEGALTVAPSSTYSLETAPT